MPIEKLDKCVPQSSNAFAQWLGKQVLKRLGWKICGTFPKRSKFVVAVAPHTSNWDFVIAVAAMLALQLKVRFLGKDALFFWPFSWWLNKIGGIPVERNSNHGVVGQMTTLFLNTDKLVLGIAPEGTRRKTNQWKSGFLHIAYNAQVPVVPLSLDFNKKEIRVYNEVFIGENIAQELASFKSIYTHVTPKNIQGI